MDPRMEVGGPRSDWRETKPSTRSRMAPRLQRARRTVAGYACDMTVFDVDPYALGPGNAHELLDAHVLMTVINGEILFPKQ